MLILGLAALAALTLALARPSPPDKSAQRRAASHVLALAVALQSIHFLEETATGFYERFPAMLGVPAMPFPFFIIFNLLWLVIWVVSIPGLRSGRFIAFFAAWFLAIAAALNGIGHPLMALAAGEYFPGLLSSPFIGAAGVWLWRKLRYATEPGQDVRSSAA